MKSLQTENPKGRVRHSRPLWVEVLIKIAQEGKILARPVKGGAALYLPEDVPTGSKIVLNKIAEKVDTDLRISRMEVLGNNI